MAASLTQPLYPALPPSGIPNPRKDYRSLQRTTAALFLTAIGGTGILCTSVAAGFVWNPLLVSFCSSLSTGAALATQLSFILASPWGAGSLIALFLVAGAITLILIGVRAHRANQAIPDVHTVPLLQNPFRARPLPLPPQPTHAQRANLACHLRTHYTLLSGATTKEGAASAIGVGPLPENYGNPQIYPNGNECEHRILPSANGIGSLLLGNKEAVPCMQPGGELKLKQSFKQDRDRTSSEPFNLPDLQEVGLVITVMSNATKDEPALSRDNDQLTAAEHLVLEVEDDFEGGVTPVSIVGHLPTIVAQINQTLAIGKNVLIHCAAGQSRSAATLGLIMMYQAKQLGIELSARNVAEHICTKRTLVGHYTGFSDEELSTLSTDRWNKKMLLDQEVRLFGRRLTGPWAASV